MRTGAGQKRARAQAAAPKPPVETPSAFDGGDALFGGVTAWTRQISTYQAAWQQQWWGFVSDRLSKDAALMSQLASCKAADDITRTYADFYKQAMEDYQKELVTLAQLSTELTVAAVPLSPNGHDVLDRKEIDMLGKLNA